MNKRKIGKAAERRGKEGERRSVAMVASPCCGRGIGASGAKSGSRRKYRLFYYAKAFSAVGSFRLCAVALPIAVRRGGGSGGGYILYSRWRGSLKKASAPESRKYGQPFCDKLFSAPTSSLRSARLETGRGARARRRETLKHAFAKEERRDQGLPVIYFTGVKLVNKRGIELSCDVCARECVRAL